MAFQIGVHDHRGMSISLGSIRSPDVLLQAAVRQGLTRLAVPVSMGGLGASAQDLGDAIRALTLRDPAVARVACAQCLAIEALRRAPNVALREIWLPDFIDGRRAGVLPAGLESMRLDASLPVHAREEARGWRLSGQLKGVVNLQWDGYSLICPVWFAPQGGAGQVAWVLLRSEEDGLSQTLDRSDGQGDVHLREVYFREDELLADDSSALLTHVRQLQACLNPSPVLVVEGI